MACTQVQYCHYSRSVTIRSWYVAGERKAQPPEGANGKTMLPGKTPAKNKTFDSWISPSGLLERLVRGYYATSSLRCLPIA